MIYKIKFIIDFLITKFSFFAALLTAPIALFLFNKRKGITFEYYKKDSWHHGFFYLLGKKGKEKVSIIKCQMFQKQVLNEVFFSKKLLNLGLKNEVQNVISFKSYGVLSFVETSFIEGSGRTELNDSVFHTLYEDISLINKSGILLRDIKIDNFILLQNSVVFIDFTYAHYFKGNDDWYPLNNSFIELQLGFGYRGNKLVWDDMSALCKIYDMCNLSISSVRNKAERDVGKHFLQIGF